MSLPCCYIDEQTPYCENRRHGELPMCLRHTREAMRQAILDGGMPWDCLRELIQFTEDHMRLLRMAKDYDVNRATARAKLEREQEERRRKKEDAVVYYLRLTGQRIKIGWTTNLEQRMRTFRARAADILAIEPGNYKIETKRHKQFAHLRIGRSEDFREAPELLAHIEQLRAA